MPDFGLSDRTVLLVGSTGHLGSAVAAALLAQGVRLLRADRRHAGAGAPLSLSIDLSRPEGVTELLARTREFAPINHLVVTAGAYRGGQPIESTDPEDFAALHWANAALPWHLLRAFVPDLRATRGHAVLIGALSAEQARPRQTPYNASKSALHSIVRTVAQEVATSGATVNALLPSVIDSPANRRDRPGADPSLWASPARLAEVVSFLLSDAAQDINGALIPVAARV